MQNEPIIFDPINSIDDEPSENDKIHIRIRQRNGRKNITTIDGLPKNLDLQKILQYMKNNFHCNGGIQNKSIIMLFGDQRTACKKFLTKESLALDENIIVHGY